MILRRTRHRASACLLLAAAAAAGCAPSSDAADAADSTAAADTSAMSNPATAGATPVATGEWRPLFDGTSLAGWRNYQKQGTPEGWGVEDGTLVRTGRGGDIVTDQQFANFELELEWMVAQGGNSGVMYRVLEEGTAPYETGPEMQVLDDANHPDGQTRLTSAGAVYGLYPAPEGVVKPAGEWNQARLVVNGNHVEHWLNGTKTGEYELGSEDWTRRVAESKFTAWPGYGKAARGHIALQDHGDRVAFRNIRLRELP